MKDYHQESACKTWHMGPTDLVICFMMGQHDLDGHSCLDETLSFRDTLRYFKDVINLVDFIACKTYGFQHFDTRC